VPEKYWMPAGVYPELGRRAGMTDGESIFILLGAFRPFRDIENRATMPLHFVVAMWLQYSYDANSVFHDTALCNKGVIYV